MSVFFLADCLCRGGQGEWLGVYVGGELRGCRLQMPTRSSCTRDLGTAYEFISDLANRLRNRVQHTTDGHRPYLSAVEDAFGADIDYAVLQKLYGWFCTRRRDALRPRTVHRHEV